MPHQDSQPGISVGPHGIHIGTTQRAAPEPALALARHAFTRLPQSGQLQRWIGAYGRPAAFALLGAGGLVLLVSLVIIGGLGLPGLLYVPMVAAVGMLWLGALAVHVLQRASRQMLARATERQILELAARTDRALTVPHVARSLGLSLAEAEAALTAMAGEGHSHADVDLDTGELQFVIPRHPDPRP